MQGTMLGAEPLLVVELELRHDLGRDEGIAQTLPYIFHGSGRGMNEVVGVETVVTEFVENNLVSGEVGHLFGELLLQAVDSHEQHRFAELVLMHSVALMADRADGEHPVFVGHRADERSPSGKNLLVCYHMIVAVIDIRRTEGDEHCVCLFKRLMKLGLRLQTMAEHLLAIRARKRAVMRHRVVKTVVLNQFDSHITVERLHDTERVVEYAGRIAVGVQTIGLHLRTYLVRKTRADEKDAAVK